MLYARNQPGDRPSHDGCFECLDPAADVARSAGPNEAGFGGAGHFALTEDFDHWTKRDGGEACTRT